MEEHRGGKMAMRAILFRDDAVRTSIRFLNELLHQYPDRNFAVRLWDGTVWGETAQPRFTLVLKNPGALRRMLLEPSQLSLGETYIYDEVDIEGDITAVFDLGDHLLSQGMGVTDKMRLGSLLLKLPSISRPEGDYRPADLGGVPHSKQRDREAIKYHYDLPGEFYALFLDRRMAYSCAYFSSPEDDLDTAQTQKLEYLCRKLRLQEGERILDVGCGWGGLMMYAAKSRRVHAFGITLSVPQAEFAREQFRFAGVTDRCIVEVCDYRDLDPPAEYDKVVSVGMFEHVGEAFLPEYFKRTFSCLASSGVFLLHGIASSCMFKRTGPSFIDKYVFPDGELLPINAVLRVAESVGFEIRDVENLREHYVLTLDRWLRNLEANAERARAIVGDVTYRIWRLYMAGSAHAFRTGRLNLFQVLLSKPNRGASGLLLTREDWYK
jgi:cyclopropane-fatty-acyl-phospholipid synthase